MKPERLDAEAAKAALAALDGWALEEGGGAILKSFVFADFSAAFGFMARAALAAEKLDHHPEWSNVYNRVEVRLTTHSARGLTALDLDLARTMDRLAGG
ncbi:MAG: 4a-hydroxytetrahydrobiopterin dehydratase [Aquamicrobium sp.]|uniref:4a-hydroxytetrahydrobiopterin dehydratase n=1 Tax=Aquamicrobium sp. TaxID=1872579 RepID=UPI00349EEBB5|nr:4a-hydroxytetrahydrobiopterin dehydratase [Aquamicrobium sp.]